MGNDDALDFFKAGWKIGRAEAVLEQGPLVVESVLFDSGQMCLQILFSVG